MAPQAKEQDIEMGNAAVDNHHITPAVKTSPAPQEVKVIVEETNDNTPKKSSQEKDDDHNYKSLKWRFFVQVGMTATVSAFCITMMSVNGKEGIYLPVLTGMLGYWLPSPDFRVKRSAKN